MSRNLGLIIIGIAIQFVIGYAQTKDIHIVVRADDMGSTRSANYACIEAYELGIVKSVEIMVPGPWFENAAKLLAERPHIDVGIHLTLTAEWTDLKWRPLTNCTSVLDEDGYFISSFEKTNPEKWNLVEIETELRAQIELALKRMPNITHLSEHMGCLSRTAATKQLFHRLAKAYNLKINDNLILPFPRWNNAEISAQQKTTVLIEKIENLTPGIYLLVEHPAYDDFESQGMGHVGYEQVAKDRFGVLKALTDEKVKAAIKKRNIKLISYKDLK